MPCSVVVGYQRFGGPCCLHLKVWSESSSPWKPQICHLTLHSLHMQVDVLRNSHFYNQGEVRQQSPPKRWYPATSLHSVTTQKTATLTSYLSFINRFKNIIYLLLCLLTRMPNTEHKERHKVLWITWTKFVRACIHVCTNKINGVVLEKLNLRKYSILCAVKYRIILERTNTSER
jgi:hypothetical protein